MSVLALSSFNGNAVSGRAEYFMPDGEPGHDQENAGTGGMEDYYVGAVDDVGGSFWHGAGAESLGLTGQPDRESFQAVFSGCDPATGERLKQTNTNNADPSKERAGFDLAFNADKSVSALYAMGDESTKQALERAMQDSARQTLDYMAQQGYLSARTGKAGMGGNVASDRYLAAVFTHCTNRNQDPHLHTHVELANMVQGPDGKWRALDSSELFRRQSEIRYVHDVALAEALQREGISITENESGVAARGINPDLLAEWSSRRAEIVAELKALGISGRGNRDTNVAVTVSGREDKDEALDRFELYDGWQEKAREYGYSEEWIRDAQAVMGDELVRGVKEDQLHAELLNHRSTFHSRDFQRLAAKYTVGRGGVADIDATADYLKETLDVVHIRDDIYTTKRVMASEIAIFQSAIGRQGETCHRIDPDQVTRKMIEVRDAAIAKAKADGTYDPKKDYGLNQEQAAALRHLTADTGGVAILEGAAGTGKSFTMKAVREVYEANGFQVRGLAPSGKAADELQKGSGIQSETIHSLLLKLENDKIRLHENQVLVLDEAGMTDSISLARLMDRAHEAGAKVILAGDSHQLEAVNTAGVLEDLGREIGSANLTQIARQWIDGDRVRTEQLRETSKQFFERNGQAAAAMLDKVGLYHQADDTTDQLKVAIEKFQEKLEANGGNYGETLMLADSREQVAKLNQIIREARFERGELDPKQGIEIDTLTDRDELVREEFFVGDRVMFRKNDKDLAVKNGTVGTIEGITQDENGRPQLQVRLDGDKGKPGALVTVDPEEYQRIELAYAMTVHKSQGMTVQSGVYVASERSDARSYYVAFTRGREGIEIVGVTPQDELAEQFERVNDKMTVMEAHKNRETGENRLLESVRQQAVASAKVAGPELASSNRVLADEYRQGVKRDLDDEYTGRNIKLSEPQRQELVDSLGEIGEAEAIKAAPEAAADQPEASQNDEREQPEQDQEFQAEQQGDQDATDAAAEQAAREAEIQRQLELQRQQEEMEGP